MFANADRLLKACGVAICVVAILVAIGARAEAQGLDASTLASVGGPWLADCADSTSAIATVFADSLVVTSGSRRLVCRDLQPAYSYFGSAPPDGYVVALLATAPGGLEVLGVVCEDSTGMRLAIEIYPAQPEAQAGGTFHRCGGAPAAVAAPTLPARTYELHELGASGILTDPAAKAAWFAALGPLREETWLAELDGPSPQNRRVTVDGVEYLFACACKNHDCADNSVVLFYLAERSVVYAMIQQSGRFTLLGTPGSAVAAALDRLWWEEFRRN